MMWKWEDSILLKAFWWICDRMVVIYWNIVYFNADSILFREKKDSDWRLR